MRRVAAEHLHRRHEAQELVDRGVGEPVGVAEQLRPQLRVLSEVQEAHAHRARGRLVAREQHHHPELPDLGVGQALAVDLRPDERPEEVVARLPLAVLDQLVDVGLSLASGLRMIGAVEDGVGVHPLDPVEPQRLVFFRQVHQPGE